VAVGPPAPGRASAAKRLSPVSRRHRGGPERATPIDLSCRAARNAAWLRRRQSLSRPSASAVASRDDAQYVKAAHLALDICAGRTDLLMRHRCELERDLIAAHGRRGETDAVAALLPGACPRSAALTDVVLELRPTASGPLRDLLEAALATLPTTAASVPVVFWLRHGPAVLDSCGCSEPAAVAPAPGASLRVAIARSGFVASARWSGPAQTGERARCLKRAVNRLRFAPLGEDIDEPAVVSVLLLGRHCELR